MCKAQTVGYMKPSEKIAQIVDAMPFPVVKFTPDGEKMIVFEWKNTTTIEQLSQEELKLAGLRFNPKNYAQSRAVLCNNIKITSTKDQKTKQISGMPANAQIRSYQFSADYKYLIFSNITNKNVEIWLVDIAETKAKKIAENINDIFPCVPFDWHVSGNEIFYLKAVNINTNPPEKNVIILPIAEETKGKNEALTTYQDLLKNVEDENIFNHYAKSQITKLDIKTLKETPIGKPEIISDFSLSPDGNFVLVTALQQPYSYNVPYQQFSHRVEIINLINQETETITMNKLQERGFNTVQDGIRNVAWRSDKPSEVFWVKKLDSNNQFKDAVICYPIGKSPVRIVNLKNNFDNIKWLNDTFALITEFDKQTKKTVVTKVNPQKHNPNPDTIFCYNKEDRYNFPGLFLTTYKNGKQILLTNKETTHLYLIGDGSSPEGDKPFLKSYDIKNHKIEEIWRSNPPKYSVCDSYYPDKKTIIVKTESNQEYPNYHLITPDNDVQISNFENPYKALDEIKTEKITYTRQDGVTLNATLYLPKNFEKGISKPLPAIIWAYPTEYKNEKTASQNSGSPYKFPTINNLSPAVFALEGYAVLEKASFPIISQNEKPANDTYLEQLELNAKAAVKLLIDNKIADKNKIAIGGHSYGAFMAINLAAHTNLFAAAIARSGAYNRTLTPFGFQNETRTLWQAPEIYLKMSPFMYADKIKIPILLIHGAEDNNPGTYTMQSERLFSAIKSTGGTARLVLLPKESHNYQAIESILHVNYESINWLNRFLKQ